MTSLIRYNCEPSREIGNGAVASADRCDLWIPRGLRLRSKTMRPVSQAAVTFLLGRRSKLQQKPVVPVAPEGHLPPINPIATRFFPGQTQLPLRRLSGSQACSGSPCPATLLMQPGRRARSCERNRSLFEKETPSPYRTGLTRVGCRR
jgi:hypothetical protein